MSITNSSSLFVTNILSFMVYLCTQNITLVESARAWEHVCQNSTQPAFANNTLYQSSVNDLLLKLSSNVNNEGQGFWYTTVGKTATTVVYGSYLCRGDLSSCYYCVDSAVNDILRLCPNNPQAYIWYKHCMLRYSNEDFYGIVSTAPARVIYSLNRTTDSSKVQNIDNFTNRLIVNATMEKSTKLFAANEFDVSDNETWYGLVQCTRDINSSSCRNCLVSLLNQFPSVDYVSAVLMAPSCFIRRHTHLFFNLNNLPETPDANPAPVILTPNPGRKKGPSKAVIVIIITVAVTLVAALSAYCCRNGTGQKPTSDLVLHDHRQLEDSLKADLPIMPLSIIKHCTNHFSDESKLGRGGFGSVYKGVLPNGKDVAIKRLSRTSHQGFEEFKNEVIFIAKLQHRNLVRLLGCCMEENEKVLVYEYMPNSSLDYHLFDESKRKELDWKLRLNIIQGIAKEDAADRPTMPNIAFMLSNDMVNLPNPKEPAFSVGRTVVEQEQLIGTSKNCSANEVTISDIGPR
ncbi:hypothetical protein L6164_023239 [Bauhinia variegata]|uniref:Uncharacterized protein n=1 Tax=Bauhinia variegata TaxID=167791 RepID=A0ACB9MJ08_BAUVA|nr:hypothetical protein L6164_023239 [Bauhinia variegata]